MIIALTGATGFVGKRVLAQAAKHGHQVRALTRRPQPAQKGIYWIEGSLERPPTLETLVEGCDAVIHAAGSVNAPDRDGFAKNNIHGTQAMIDAAMAANVRRFVHVSSLAAREPQLSNYGWSKAESERRVGNAALDWTVVRPPAVYGPGDLEMLDTFRMARLGFALLPPRGRMSVIHVDDLARLLITLTLNSTPNQMFEVDDGLPGGWTHAEYFAGAIGSAVERRVIALPLPKPVLMFAAQVDLFFRRNNAKLTPDRVNYMCHPDWTVDPQRRPPETLWLPEIATVQGLVETAKWYRAQGLL